MPADEKIGHVCVCVCGVRYNVEIVGLAGSFFWLVAAKVRVPDSSSFSQLNLHETDETKVV